MFSGRVIIIGFGNIGQGLLPLLLQQFNSEISKVTIIEAGGHEDALDRIKSDKQINYVTAKLNSNNSEELIYQHVAEGDYVVNVTTAVDTPTIVRCCQSIGALYIDTGNGFWPNERFPKGKLAQRTQYFVQNQFRKYANQEIPPMGPTTITNHGANPGLVSAFTKAALMVLAKEKFGEILAPMDQMGWASLCYRLGVKVIHISERDTQATNIPKRPNEFVCSWSVEGMIEEGSQLAEIAIGTHEKYENEYFETHNDDGPNHGAYFTKPGFRILSRSWVPSCGPIQGFVIQHRETVSMGEYFSIFKNKKRIYGPTVNYCYFPCDSTIASVHEFLSRDLKPQGSFRTINQEIISGMDELGVLIMGEFPAVWFGSQLSIEQCRKIDEFQNATTMQVVAGVLSAMKWSIANPRKGYVEPDQLPFDYILEIAKPYLGDIVVERTNWNPTRGRSELYPDFLIDREHLWRLQNFLVQ